MTLALSKCRTSYTRETVNKHLLFLGTPEKKYLCSASLLAAIFVTAHGHFSSCRTRTLEPQLSSCHSSAGDLSLWIRIEPTSYIEGGLLTTAPLEKSPFVFSSEAWRSHFMGMNSTVSDFPIVLAFLLRMT